MPALRTGALLVAVAALAGCGAGGTGASAGTAPALTVTPGGHVCLDLPGTQQLSSEVAARQRPALGAGQVAAFVECDVVSERVPRDGEWTVRRERRADAGVQALADALRLPDLPSTDGACAAYGQMAPELYALDGAGRGVLVRWPLDGCGHLRREAVAAHSAVRWASAVTRRLNQVVSQAAIDSGCPDRVKQMAAIEGADTAARQPRVGGLGALTAARSVKACTYTIDDRSATPTGALDAGRTLRGADWQRMRVALEATPAAPQGCTRLGQRFAVLSADPGGWVFVELDGCRRVLLPDGSLRTATPRLLEELVRI